MIIMRNVHHQAKSISASCIQDAAGKGRTAQGHLSKSIQCQTRLIKNTVTMSYNATIIYWVLGHSNDKGQVLVVFMGYFTPSQAHVLYYSHEQDHFIV